VITYRGELVELSNAEQIDLCGQSSNLVVLASHSRITETDLSSCTLSTGSIVATIIFAEGVSQATVQAIVDALNSRFVLVTLVTEVELPLISAALKTLVGGTAAPTTQSPVASSNDKKTLSDFEVILLILCGLVATAVIILCLLWCCYRERHTEERNGEEQWVTQSTEPLYENGARGRTAPPKILVGPRVEPGYDGYEYDDDFHGVIYDNPHFNESRFRYQVT
jgi:hypothetical protein